MISGSEGLSYCELMSGELYMTGELSMTTKIKIKWCHSGSTKKSEFWCQLVNTELVNTVYKCITNFRNLKLKNSAFMLDLRYSHFLMLRVTNKTNPCCDILSSAGCFIIGFSCFSKRYDHVENGITSSKSFALCHPDCTDRVFVIILYTFIFEFPFKE